MLPAAAPYKAPYNETHWPPKSGTGSNYISLYQQARAEVDRPSAAISSTRCRCVEYNYGGYIIPFFNNLVDAYSSKVAGWIPSTAGQH